MKYVRTKDKIIKVDETGYIKEIDVCGNKCLFLFNKNYLYGREVIKQADTIEELCDKFIDEELHYIIKNKEIIKDIPNNPELKNHKIYGAIWTDTGLIYVAKMNSKGELELCQN